MIQASMPIKIISILLLIILLSISFFSSYDALKIDNLAFVIALGIDKSRAGDNFQITFQIAKPSSMAESSSSKGSTATIDTVETNSIGSAINLINSYIEKQVNFSHCKLIVFSESVAKDGLSDEIFTLMNNLQIRPTTNIVVSKTDAKYYIENSTTNLEILPTSYYEVFPNSSKYTGYSTNSNLGLFFNALNSDTTEASAILGGVISSNQESMTNYAPETALDYSNMESNETPIYGERGAENIGLAVFKGDRLVGELNAIETVCYSIISNKISSFFVTIEDPDNYDNYIDLNVFMHHNTKVNVDIINSTPFITLNCSLEARINSISNNTNYLDEDFLNRVSLSAEKNIKLELYNYLYKTSKELKSDISGFGKYALSNFLTTEDFDRFNWTDNYQNSFFKVNCDVIVKSRKFDF